MAALSSKDIVRYLVFCRRSCLSYQRSCSGVMYQLQVVV